MPTAGQETATTWQRSSRPTQTVQPPAIDPPRTLPRTVEPDEFLLLASKLTVPDPPAAVVDRPRLTKLLDTATRGPVTMVAAPAGWGKTVLLSSWLSAGGSAHPAVWLTLEEGDEGRRFWSYLQAGLTTAELPHHPPGPPTGPSDEAFLPRLAAAVAARHEPVLVILDDFHLVHDPTVLRGLEFLLRHSNGRFRLVIAARTEPVLPLHRWRLTGELTELRAGDLAFTEAETAELIARHGLTVPRRLAQTVHARTEGWAAGVRLAALALRGDPDPARFVADFAGDHQGVADYLTAELLTPLTGEVRDLLLRTAVLDRVSGESADAVTGGGDGERLLTTAVGEANGFVVPLPGEPGWYRYHRLVGDLLHAELSRQRPGDLAELHRRAARWHAAHGFPAAALRHALAGHDWPTAEGLLAAHWPQLTLCGHDETLRAALPSAPPETLRTAPLLALAYATDRLDVADPDGADDQLRLAARHTDADPRGHARPESAAAALAAGRLVRAQATGDLGEVIRAAHDLVAGTASERDRPAEQGHVIALTALGGAHLSLGEFAPAETVLTEALQRATAIGFGCAERRGGALLGLLHAIRGQLRAAETTARTALAVPACRGRRCAGHVAAAHLALAVVHHQRDERAEADRQLERVVEPAAEPALIAPLAIVRAWVREASGDRVGALEVLLAGRRELHDGHRTRHLDHWLCATEAELRGAHGDGGGARDLLAAALARSTEPADELTVALARTHLRAGDPATAVATLPDWPADREPQVPLASRLDAAVVRALAVRALGDGRRAHDILERVLELAVPDGHRRIFTRGGGALRSLLAEHLDCGTAHRSTVNDLVEATSPPPDDGRRAAPAEPLTDRELTILRYLQSTLSNGEIAAELFLSVNTVKTHVRNIYQKLGAPRRREAVRRARELRLL